MRKVFFTLLIVFIQIFSIFPGGVKEHNRSYDTGVINVAHLPTVKDKHNNTTVKLYAVSSLAYDVRDNKILFARNTKQKIAPASLTKLLTALIAVDYLPLDMVLTVGDEIDLVQPGSSIAYLRKTNRIKFRNLLYGLLLPSGCDAAYTIAVNTARYVSGLENMSDEAAVEFFVILMNRYAKKLGMYNSNFVNPEGYDDPNQYITAEDMLILASHVFNNSILKETVSNHEKYVVFESGRTVTWENTNLMLNEDDIYYKKNVTGMKTGSSELAGKSFIGVYEDNQHTFITIVLGCSDYYFRYVDTHMLITYALAVA